MTAVSGRPTIVITVDGFVDGGQFNIHAYGIYALNGSAVYLDKHADVVVSGYGLFVYLFESLRDGRATIDLRADTIRYDEVRNTRYG